MSNTESGLMAAYFVSQRLGTRERHQIEDLIIHTAEPRMDYADAYAGIAKLRVQRYEREWTFSAAYPPAMRLRSGGY